MVLVTLLLFFAVIALVLNYMLLIKISEDYRHEDWQAEDREQEDVLLEWFRKKLKQ